MAKVVGVIPARYASTRFPGKSLAAVSGKPLLQWVIEGAKTSKKLDKLIVATDDARIAELSNKCGVESVMTSSELPSGTDRINSATQNLNYDIVVNIQGDEPLIKGTTIDQLISVFNNQSDLQMATLAQEITDEELNSSHSVKVILNKKNEAIYFSRFPIPFSRVGLKEINMNKEHMPLKHIGMYAYRQNFLKEYCAQSPVLIEVAESLEQLRAIYLGAKIKVVRTHEVCIGVDVPEDVKRVENYLRERT